MRFSTSACMRSASSRRRSDRAADRMRRAPPTKIGASAVGGTGTAGRSPRPRSLAKHACRKSSVASVIAPRPRIDAGRLNSLSIQPTPTPSSRRSPDSSWIEANVWPPAARDGMAGSARRRRVRLDVGRRVGERRERLEVAPVDPSASSGASAMWSTTHRSSIPASPRRARHPRSARGSTAAPCCAAGDPDLRGFQLRGASAISSDAMAPTNRMMRARSRRPAAEQIRQ